MPRWYWLVHQRKGSPEGQMQVQTALIAGRYLLSLVANEPDIEGVQDRTITGRTAIAVQCRDTDWRY
jgi:hypothetical protein